MFHSGTRLSLVLTWANRWRCSVFVIQHDCVSQMSLRLTSTKKSSSRVYFTTCTRRKDSKLDCMCIIWYCESGGHDAERAQNFSSFVIFTHRSKTIFESFPEWPLDLQQSKIRFSDIKRSVCEPVRQFRWKAQNLLVQRFDKRWFVLPRVSDACEAA